MSTARRTPTITLDEDWSYGAQVCKAGHDAQGRRFIQGVASGVLEDADGERVSRNALVKMARQALGGLKLTSSHAQDWSTEIGDLVDVQHDARSDELLVKAVLPPEGEDAIADKAWNALTKQGEKLGFSIGGKLKGAFFEATDTGKRRKVLDEIHLRHVMLTKVPAYKGSFAQAVAKSMTEAAPEQLDAYTDVVDDEEELPVDLVLVDERDEATKTAAAAAQVAKAAKPGDDSENPDDVAPDDGDGDEAKPSDDAAPAGDDAPAEAKPDAPATGEMSDAEASQALPVAQHFACPSCGAEFASPLAADETPDRPTPTDDTAKTASRKETTMDPNTQETLERIRGLADAGEAVAKSTDPDPEAAAAATEPVRADDAVAKGDLSLEGLADVVAKSHVANEHSTSALRGEVTEGFAAVAKAFTGLKTLIEELPQGRKSVARVLPTRDEVEKSATETDDVEKAVEEASSPLDAIKALNAANGIR